MQASRRTRSRSSSSRPPSSPPRASATRRCSRPSPRRARKSTRARPTARSVASRSPPTPRRPPGGHRSPHTFSAPRLVLGPCCAPPRARLRRHRACGGSDRRTRCWDRLGAILGEERQLELAARSYGVFPCFGDPDISMRFGFHAFPPVRDAHRCESHVIQDASMACTTTPRSVPHRGSRESVQLIADHEAVTATAAGTLSKFLPTRFYCLDSVQHGRVPHGSYGERETGMDDACRGSPRLPLRPSARPAPGRRIQALCCGEFSCADPGPGMGVGQLAGDLDISCCSTHIAVEQRDLDAVTGAAVWGIPVPEQAPQLDTAPALLLSCA